MQEFSVSCVLEFVLLTKEKGRKSPERIYSFYVILNMLHAGDDLYDSAARFRIPDLPAFALECLPNRNSLVYGDLYGIGNEASTIFRGTLRYEGMYCLKIYAMILFCLNSDLGC